jgi:ribonucleoside-triphosphate reductase (thioredoxin)
MGVSDQILSDIIVHNKYAKYLPSLKRRENWGEEVDRNKKMHLDKFPSLSEEIEWAYTYIYDMKVLPSMRSLQFAGKPIELSPNRLYNCCYAPIEDIEIFSEAMFLLLGGSGFGFSCQKHHIEKLPLLKGDIRTVDGEHPKRYLIGDSIEGWADAIKVLIESYFLGKKEIAFDFRDIRSKGVRLVTSGGKAPGPQPLKDCIHNIKKVLDTALAERGRNIRLKPIEAHDIMCHIADAVLSGGIRRAAMISLFSLDDEEMLSCKYGNWYEKNPQRGRANNSVTLLRHRITKENFEELWKKIKFSGSGEPGIFFTNDKDWGANPCFEIALRPYMFCNLTTINAGNIVDQTDFNDRCKAASFIGTLQASYTDFHYLRDIWRIATEKEALLGVSMTGIASDNFINTIDLKQGAEIVKKENERVAKILKINKATRTCCVKPEGTTSTLLGTSSGVHAWHNDYYIRRIRVGKNESLYTYFSITNPQMIEDDVMKKDLAIINFPIKAPENSILRSESPIHLLERMKKINEDWIKIGHRKGANTHNVSLTVSIKDDEWDLVRDWMWENRNYYSGISVLPYDGGSYVQAPFEDISKEKYEELIKNISPMDINLVTEDEDNTDQKGEIACGGGACQII